MDVDPAAAQLYRESEPQQDGAHSDRAEPGAVEAANESIASMLNSVALGNRSPQDGPSAAAIGRDREQKLQKAKRASAQVMKSGKFSSIGPEPEAPSAASPGQSTSTRLRRPQHIYQEMHKSSPNISPRRRARSPAAEPSHKNIPFSIRQAKGRIRSEEQEDDRGIGPIRNSGQRSSRHTRDTIGHDHEAVDADDWDRLSPAAKRRRMKEPPAASTKDSRPDLESSPVHAAKSRDRDLDVRVQGADQVPGSSNVTRSIKSRSEARGKAASAQSMANRLTQLATNRLENAAREHRRLRRSQKKPKPATAESLHAESDHSDDSSLGEHIVTQNGPKTKQSVPQSTTARTRRARTRSNPSKPDTRSRVDPWKGSRLATESPAMESDQEQEDGVAHNSVKAKGTARHRGALHSTQRRKKVGTKESGAHVSTRSRRKAPPNAVPDAGNAEEDAEPRPEEESEEEVEAEARGHEANGASGEDGDAANGEAEGDNVPSEHEGSQGEQVEDNSEDPAPQANSGRRPENEQQTDHQPGEGGSGTEQSTRASTGQRDSGLRRQRELLRTMMTALKELGVSNERGQATRTRLRDIPASNAAVSKIVELVDEVNETFRNLHDDRENDRLQTQMTSRLERIEEAIESVRAEPSEEDEAETAIQDIYAHGIPSLVRMTKRAFDFYEQDDYIDSAGLEKLLRVQGLIRLLGQVANACKKRPRSNLNLVKPTRNKILPALRELQNSVREELQARATRAQRQRDLAALEDYDHEREQRESDEKARNRQEVITQRRKIIERLAQVRQQTDPHVREKQYQQTVLRSSQPPSTSDLAPLRPATPQRDSPPPTNTDNPDTTEWAPEEVLALVQGLEKFTGLNRYEQIWENAGQPSQPLQSRNLDELFQKAREVRSDVLADLESNPGVLPEWMQSI